MARINHVSDRVDCIMDREAAHPLGDIHKAEEADAPKVRPCVFYSVDDAVDLIHVFQRVLHGGSRLYIKFAGYDFSVIRVEVEPFNHLPTSEDNACQFRNCGGCSRVVIPDQRLRYDVPLLFDGHISRVIRRAKLYRQYVKNRLRQLFDHCQRPGFVRLSHEPLLLHLQSVCESLNLWVVPISVIKKICKCAVVEVSHLPVLRRLWSGRSIGRLPQMLPL